MVCCLIWGLRRESNTRANQIVIMYVLGSFLCRGFTCLAGNIQKEVERRNDDTTAAASGTNSTP